MEKGIDHWSAGAWEALTRYRTQGIASALAIQGHSHRTAAGCEGLASHPGTRNKLVQAHPLGLRLYEAGAAPLLQRPAADGIALPDPG